MNKFDGLGVELDEDQIKKMRAWLHCPEADIYVKVIEHMRSDNLASGKTHDCDLAGLVRAKLAFVIDDCLDNVLKIRDYIDDCFSQLKK